MSLKMDFMFNKCSSLLYFPDISNWNVNNVEDISYMFNMCSSLSIIPNINKWNINFDNIETEFVFGSCFNIINFHISKIK